MFKKIKNAPWYGYVVVALLCLAMALPNFAQYQVTTLADRIRTDLSLSQSSYSSIATAPLLAGIVLSFASGLLMDRFGSKVLLISVLITAAGIILRAFVSGYWPLFISMILLGFSASFVNTTTPKLAGQWFPPSRVTVVMGVVLAFSSLGTAIGSGTATMFPTTSAAFTVAAMFALIVVVLWLLLPVQQKESGSKTEHGSILEGVKVVLGSGGVWACAVCNIGIMLGMLSNIIFIPQALMSRGLSEQEAGWYSAILTVGNMLTTMLSPSILRKLCKNAKQMRILFRCCAFAGGVMVATAWLLPKGALLAIGLFITGFVVEAFLPALQSMPSYVEGIGEKYAATATGLAMTMQLLCCVTIPSYIVAPIAGDNYPLIFGILGAVAIIPTLLAGKLPFERVQG